MGYTVDLKEKIEEALRKHVKPEVIELRNDDGIYGFVVSANFRGMSAIERQTLIDTAMRDPAVKLTRPQRRRILAIAALTPAEFEVWGPGREELKSSR